MHTKPKPQEPTCAPAFVRNLTFQSEDLGKESTLVLIFQGDPDCTHRKTFPVIWRANTFEAEGRSMMQATYTDQLAFSRVQVKHGNVVNVGNYIKIDDGQQTTMTRASDGFHFSGPACGVPNHLKASNKTGVVQDISLSIVTPKDPIIKTVLCFKDVEDGSSFKVKFTPKLHAYVSSDHQETALFEGGVTTGSIWEQDLTELPESTTFILSREPSTGHYAIEREDEI